MLRQSTEYLLKKVSAQIRGDKIPSKLQSTNKETGDDLNDYLQSLSSNKKKLTNWDQDLSDFSDEEKDHNKPIQPATNRFLKKALNTKLEQTENIATLSSNNDSLTTNKFLKKPTGPINNTTDKETLNSNQATNTITKLNDNTTNNIKNVSKTVLNVNLKTESKKLELDDSDESIVNYLDIRDLDDEDEIEIDRPKKGILKSPALSNRISSPRRNSIISTKLLNNKSEIFGNIQNIDDLISGDDIPTVQNIDYESDFESTARSVQTPHHPSKHDDDFTPRKSRKNSSIESTPRHGNKNDIRKVSISTKKEIFRSTSPKREVSSRPVTPATSRSYMSIEIEEASELKTSSSSREIAKSNSNNSTMLSTQLEVLPHSKKDKKNLRRESSKSTNYSTDFEKTFDEEELSSSSLSAPSSTTSHSSSTISVKKKSKKKNNVKNCSCQTINDLHQHWVFFSAHMNAFTLPESKFSKNILNSNMIYINPQSLKDLSMQSPAADAFNDLMKQQLSMMRQYIAIQAALHAQLIQTFNNLSPYHYTTLDETKEYININKPKIVSYEEALLRVKQEAES